MSATIITSPLLGKDVRYKGYFATELDLTTAYPVGQNGWFADIGATDTIWVWDGDTSSWVDTGSGPSGDMLKSVYDPTNRNTDIFAEIDSKSDKWTISEITSDVNPAVKNTIYLCDCSSSNINITIPDSTVGNTGDEFRAILKNDTNKVVVTTVGGTQLINNKTIQEIHTVNGQLFLKSNGTGYEVITDTRAYYRTIYLNGAGTTDLSTSGYESGSIYHCEPGDGNTRTIIIPDSTVSCEGNFAKFMLDGLGSVVVKTLSGELIKGEIEQVITTGGFELACFGDHYGITQDSRPKVQNTSLTLYSLDESSTIVDPAGGFYKATATTITDSRYNQATGTEITSVAITGLDIYLAGGVSDEGIIQGVLPEGPINTWVNARKISGVANFTFYVKYYKKTSLGVETLIGTSTTSQIVSSNTTTQYIVTATLSETTFSSTDRILRKVFLNKNGVGTDPVAGVTLEGPYPTYSIVSIGAGSISHNILAGKQGGIAGEYYHLTTPQHSIINSSTYNKTTAPTINDDSGDGYVVGSRWVDTTGDKEYVCTDNTLGAAVWVETTGAGGLTYFTESQAVYDTHNASQLDAIGSTGRVDILLRPKGGGGSFVGEWGFTTLGKRGNWSVDIQTYFNEFQETIASGDNSVCLGNLNKASGNASTALGVDNQSTEGNSVSVGGGNRSTNINSVSFGFYNTSSGISSTANGNQNISSGLGSVAMGTGNNVSANYASGFGINNIANSEKATATGYNATTSGIIGKIAEGNGIIATDGDSQIGKFILRAQTTDATTVYMTTNNSTLDTNNHIVLKNHSTYSFRGQIVARRLNSESNLESKAWDIMGVVRRGDDAASVSLVGTPTIIIIGEDTGTELWDVELAASSTYGSLIVGVEGGGTASIQWVATIYTTECIY